MLFNECEIVKEWNCMKSIYYQEVIIIADFYYFKKPLLLYCLFDGQYRYLSLSDPDGIFMNGWTIREGYGQYQ